MTQENQNTPNPITPESLDLSSPLSLEPYDVTYGSEYGLDTGTIKGLVNLESHIYARELPKGELPGSGRGDTATVLQGFDAVDSVSQNKVRETLRQLRWERSVTDQPKPGLFKRLAEAGRIKGALTSVIVVVGIGGLLIEALNYGENSAQQYMRDHPHAVQTP